MPGARTPLALQAARQRLEQLHKATWQASRAVASELGLAFSPIMKGALVTWSARQASKSQENSACLHVGWARHIKPSRSAGQKERRTIGDFSKGNSSSWWTSFCSPASLAGLVMSNGLGPAWVAGSTCDIVSTLGSTCKGVISSQQCLHPTVPVPIGTPSPPAA